jgi:Holliday junction DNA helicase RuvB
MRRPQDLSTYVGQSELKPILEAEIKAAQKGGKTFRHALLYGSAGCGKSSLGRVISNTLGYQTIQICASKDWTPSRIAQMFLELPIPGYGPGGVRQSANAPRYCIIVDEIHAMPSTSYESLYHPLEDQECYHQTGVSWLPDFCMIGCTTSPSSLPKPLRDRFPLHFRVGLYQPVELAQILTNQFPIDQKTALEIGKRSRGVPRVAINYAESVLNYGGLDYFTAVNIDDMGRTPLDRAYLEVLDRIGRPASIRTIGSMLAEEVSVLQELVEPFLLSIGDLQITPKGRARLGYETNQVRGPKVDNDVVDKLLRHKTAAA